MGVAQHPPLLQKDSYFEMNLSTMLQKRWNFELTCEIPLAVFHKQMPRQKEDSQWQEKEEAVVEISVANAVYVSKVPIEADDLRIEGKRHAKCRHQYISDWQIDEKVIACN